MLKSNFRWFFQIAIPASLLALWLPSQMPAVGQGWSNPENISNLPTDSAYPVVVADSSGVVHVFWTENNHEYGSFNNLIYYTRLEGQAWSQPVDILISPLGLEGTADHPTVAIGPDGRFHLAFVSGFSGQIYYSSAPVDEAGNVRGWQNPLLVSMDATQAAAPNIEIDAKGILHLTYAISQGTLQGIYHTTSLDWGATWSNPSLIPGTQLGNNTILEDLRMALSPEGEVHLAWMWTKADEVFPPRGIYSTYTMDPNHESWSNPLVVVDGPYRYPDLAFDGHGNLIMVWSGTSQDRYKFWKWSGDGGRTWSPVKKFSQLGGFQGYSGLAVDSLGNLHLGMVASCYRLNFNGKIYGGDALIHSLWDGKSWSNPEPLLLNTISENNLQYADIAISEGNIAHLVAMYPIHQEVAAPHQENQISYQFEIYYVRGLLEAPPMPLQPRLVEGYSPTLQAQQTALPQTSTEVTSVSTKTEISQDGLGEPVIRNQTFIMVVGPGLVFLLWLVIISLKKWLQQI
jgi:hypothetical protein